MPYEKSLPFKIESEKCGAVYALLIIKIIKITKATGLRPLPQPTLLVKK